MQVATQTRCIFKPTTDKFSKLRVFDSVQERSALNPEFLKLQRC